MNKDIVLKVKTRGGSSTRNKPRVYFSYHPDDFVYFEHISELILEKQDCAIFYYDYADGEPDPEALKQLLEQMQLFVIPVTYAYVYENSFAYEHEYAYARDNYIPILPLLQADDNELKRDFSRKCEKMEYLSEFRNDKTAISFDDKLEKYLSSVLVSDEDAEKIRDAFGAYVFLSYRKKDREHANRLMRLIHSVPELRDVAIWYDEYLVAGKPFDETIKNALKKSDLFALLVTPSLLEDNNFVMREEYPMARREGKEILAAESVRTDRGELEARFEGIPECVEGMDKDAVGNELLKKLKKADVDEIYDPYHDYLMGMAYLSGIDVEKNKDYAFELISYAADEGIQIAMKQLAEMYYSSNGVKRDIHKAVFWQEKLVDSLSDDYELDETPDEGEELFWERENLKNYYEEAGSEDKYIAASKENIELARKLAEYKPGIYDGFSCGILADLGDFLSKQGDFTEAERLFNEALGNFEDDDKEGIVSYDYMHAIMLNNYGLLYQREKMYENAEKYLNRALDILLRPSLQNDDRCLGTVSDIYHNLGMICHDVNDLDNAVDNYKKAIEINEKYIKLDPEFFSDRAADGYNSLSLVLKERGDYEEAEEYFKKAIEIREKAAGDNFEKYGELLADSYNNLALIYEDSLRPEEAEELFLKTIEIYSKLAGENPDRYESPLSNVYNNISTFYLDRNKFEEALDSVDRSVVLREKLVKRNYGRFCADLARSYLNSAHIRSELGREKEALEINKKAEEIFKKLYSEEPDVYIKDLATCYNNMGIYYKRYGDIESAGDYTAEATRLREKIAQKASDTDLCELSMCYRNMGQICKLEGNYQGAERMMLKAIEVVTASYDPQGEFVGIIVDEMVNSNMSLGSFYCEADEYGKAEERYFESIKILERYISFDPEKYMKKLCACYSGIAEACMLDDKEDEAISYLEKAVSGLEELSKNETDKVSQNFLSMCLNHRAIILMGRGELLEARQSMERAVEIKKKLAKYDPEKYGPSLERNYRLLESLNKTLNSKLKL